MGIHNFFSNSNRDFYSENNNVSKIYTYIPKIQKKIVICYYLSFVFPANLIWLLHCNARHFDSFSLGVRHLFQKLVLFFYVKLYL
jgi:hypothetical protein